VDKKAHFVRTVDSSEELHLSLDYALYRLAPLLDGVEYVVVGAIRICDLKSSAVLVSDRAGALTEERLAQVDSLSNAEALERIGYEMVA
jgi:hypothetical protein